MKEMFTVSNGDRRGARNVAVVITDGEANVDRWLTVPYAVEARIAGIYIVTLAVGTLADTNMLQNIASRPHDKTILQARYGHELPAFRDRIFMTSCDGKSSLLNVLFHSFHRIQCSHCLCNTTFHDQ